jgi:signal transduction histidine kinase/ActR/RegA family two-component response regulator
MINQKRSFSLLYVEDDETLRAQYSDFFRRRVDDFYEATNGEEGLELYKKHKPDIVVSDILMPKMNGIEMIKHIKDIDKNAKIIITTAYGDTQYTIEAIELNVTKYILKPMKGSALNSIINEVKDMITLEKEKELYDSYVDTIINTQPSMVILNKNRDIMIANRVFLNFIGYDSLDEFRSNHECLCDFFEDDEEYFSYKGADWVEVALKDLQNNKQVEVRIKDEIFCILISYVDKKNEYVITLSNITIQKSFERRLQVKLEEELEKNRKQEHLLIQQSKLAAMGEMLGAIAHQWRQPLNILGIKIQKLKHNYKHDEINEEFINTFIDDNKRTINFMSKTIDDFRNFFVQNKDKSLFNISESIYFIVNMLSAQLNAHNIKIDTQIESNNIKVLGYKNEFKQVLINIINNSKDAILTRQESQRELFGKIKIDLHISDDKVIMSISDNGGGIAEDIIDKIFDPYFTTKFEDKGTGIGLYMSKVIIEKNMQGKLEAVNIEDGAKFSITFDKKSYEDDE